jgi:hypothetical protein
MNLFFERRRKRITFFLPLLTFMRGELKFEERNSTNYLFLWVEKI